MRLLNNPIPLVRGRGRRSKEQVNKVGIIALTLILAMTVGLSACAAPSPLKAPLPSWRGELHPLEETPVELAIMVESDIAEAGSSFMVSGSKLNPQQKIWVKWDYRTSCGKAGCTGCGEPDEDGTIHAVIHVPEDVAPGDYEVEVYIGKHLDDRELIATLPIHIQARAR